MCSNNNVIVAFVSSVKFMHLRGFVNRRLSLMDSQVISELNDFDLELCGNNYCIKTVTNAMFGSLAVFTGLLLPGPASRHVR